MGERRVGRGTRNQDLKDESILGCCSHDCSQARTDRGELSEMLGGEATKDPPSPGLLCQVAPELYRGEEKGGRSKLVSCPPFSSSPSLLQVQRGPAAA